MAIYNLRVTPAKDRDCVLKFKYISRIDDFSWEKNEKYDDFIYSENINMPLFAKENPIQFWENVKRYERVDSNDFREIEFTLPCELSIEENIELSREFAKKILGENYVYSLAVHSKQSTMENIDNIHCHIMFSERELDGIERSPEQFFKRANSKTPEKGGCKKNREWSKFSKLYYIRQEWEEIANKKLAHLGVSISSKSLTSQRVEALLENNFLKAEMLDRPPVNIDKKFMKYSTSNEKKEQAKKLFDYAYKLKKIKEKEFRLKSENFEEENQKAKERFIKKYCEEEGIIYSPSVFDVQQKKIESEFNFENIFIKSLDTKILIDKKEKRLKQINSISEKEIENKALSILTKGEYSKKLEKLEELTEFYNNLKNKNNFKFIDKKKELEKYFQDLNNSQYFKEKLSATIKNIKYKYNTEKEEILSDLGFLRNNDYKDFYIKNSPRNYELARELMKETNDYIKELKIDKELIDKEVKEYKNVYLDTDIKREIYSKVKIEAVEKYDELKKWKEKVKSSNNIPEKEEVNKKILERELSFKNFDLKNNIKELVDKEIKIRREKYKELRQIQDDVMGKISYSFLMLKELKTLNEIKILDKVDILKNEYNGLLKQENNKLKKLEYNIELEKTEKTFERIFKDQIKLQKFTIQAFNQDEKKEFLEKLKIKIQKKTDENKKLGKILSVNLPTDENIKTRILDKNTNGMYSNHKSMIKYYEEKISSGLSVKENTIMMSLEKNKLEKIEKNCKIFSEDVKIEKQVMRSEILDITANIRTNNEKIDIYYQIMKKLNIDIRKKKKQIRKNNDLDNHKIKKLKVVTSGRIEINDNPDNLRRSMWENSL